jgi:hypothetical protein
MIHRNKETSNRILNSRNNEFNNNKVRNTHHL